MERKNTQDRGTQLIRKDYISNEKIHISIVFHFHFWWKMGKRVGAALEPDQFSWPRTGSLAVETQRTGSREGTGSEPALKMLGGKGVVENNVRV